LTTPAIVLAFIAVQLAHPDKHSARHSIEALPTAQASRAANSDAINPA